MAVTLNINGTPYSFPESGDEPWASDVTNAIVALSNPANTLYVSSVVNDLFTGGDAVPLSATQGVELKAKTDENNSLALQNSAKIEKVLVTTPVDDNIPTFDGTDGTLQDSGVALADKEDYLGNPAADGYLLQSTALGVRSWMASPGAPEGTDVLSTGEVGGTKYLRENGDGTSSWQTVVSSDTKADFLADFPAGSWDYPSTNFAPWDKDTGTYGDIYRNLFDDTTEEFVQSQFKLPPDVDTSGTVTFYIEGYGATFGSLPGDVQFKFYHSAKSNGEDWDSSDYSSKVSGDKTTNSTEDGLDFFTFTETIANLGWASGDDVRIKLSRIAPTGSSYTADYGVTHFRIRIPRT